MQELILRILAVLIICVSCLSMCHSSIWKIESLQWSHKWPRAINSNYMFFKFTSKWWFNRMTNHFIVNFMPITFLTSEQAFCIRLSVLMALGVWERCSGNLSWSSFIEKKTKTNLRCLLSHIGLQQSTILHHLISVVKEVMKGVAWGYL